MLTKRLAKCAELVSGKGIACDVGTDHAYLASELLKSGKCKKVIASDVAEGPLNAAKRNLEQAGLLERVELILSDGLKNVPCDDVSDVVIAGMGGETIAHILEECRWIENKVNLVLQPMTKIPFLREWLCQNGFGIISEQIVCEGRFFYTVMKAFYIGKNTDITDFQREVGCLNWNDETVKEYGRFRFSQFIKLSEQLAAVDSNAAEEYRKFAQEITNRIGENSSDNS